MKFTWVIMKFVQLDRGLYILMLKSSQAVTYVQGDDRVCTA